MSRRFFLYDKNIFFSEGVRSVVADHATDEDDCTFSRLEHFSQLINTLRLPKQKDERHWILCDVDSLPDERFNALYTIKEYSSAKRIKLTGGNAVSCIKNFLFPFMKDLHSQWIGPATITPPLY